MKNGHIFTPQVHHKKKTTHLQKALARVEITSPQTIEQPEAEQLDHDN